MTTRASGPKRAPATEVKSTIIRFPPDVYNAVSAAANLSGVSLNNLVVETMRNNFASSGATSSLDVLNAARSTYAASLTSPVVSVTPQYDQTFTAYQAALDALSGKKEEE